MSTLSPNASAMWKNMPTPGSITPFSIRDIYVLSVPTFLARAYWPMCSCFRASRIICPMQLLVASFLNASRSAVPTAPYLASRMASKLLMSFLGCIIFLFKFKCFLYLLGGRLLGYQNVRHIVYFLLRALV